MVLCNYYFACLIQVLNLTLKSFKFFYWWFFNKSYISESNKNFFQKFQSSLEVKRAKRKFSDNPGHNILELYNILVLIKFTTSKTKLDIQYSRLGIPVASRLAKQLKRQNFRKLGNIRKTSNLGGHIAQYLASLQEVRLCQQELKNTQKYKQNFSLSVQFDWITPFCSKYFVQDCIFRTINKRQ